MLFGVLRAAEVYVLVINNLAPFEDIQIDHLQSLCRSYTVLGLSTLAELIDIPCCVLKILSSRGELSHFFIGEKIIPVEIGIKMAGLEHIRGTLRSQHALHGSQNGRLLC